MKFTFGKYKGLDFLNILFIDKQYIGWCVNNIPNFYFNLSEENKELYLKHFFTYDYLIKKYPNIDQDKYSLQKLIRILKKEKIIKSFSYDASGYTMRLMNGRLAISDNGFDGVELFYEYSENSMISNIMLMFFRELNENKKRFFFPQ